jgi:hypothetical protein
MIDCASAAFDARGQRQRNRAATVMRGCVSAITGCVVMFASLAYVVVTGPAAHGSPTTKAPWDAAAGQRSGCASYVAGQCDEHDYTSGDPYEYGIDIPLAAGTAVYAPESGTVSYWDTTGYAKNEWQPGRLLLALDRGGLVGFGHVNAVVRSGHVVAGQQIASIGAPTHGWGSHVEFMYSPSGGQSHSDFAAYQRADPRSPFSLLIQYFTGGSPQPTQAKHRGVATTSNGDGRLEVLAIGGDGQLYHAYQTAPGGAWSSVGPLGGVLHWNGAPAIGRNPDGRLEAVAIANDGSLQHAYQTAPSGGWSGFAALSPAGWFPDGRIATVASNTDGRLEVFAIGGDRQLYHAYQTAPGGAWSSVGPLGGGL